MVYAMWHAPQRFTFHFIKDEKQLIPYPRMWGFTFHFIKEENNWFLAPVCGGLHFTSLRRKINFLALNLGQFCDGIYILITAVRPEANNTTRYRPCRHDTTRCCVHRPQQLFSYNKNVNFPDISVGKNKINETSVSKFLGIHLDKKLNFVNHITEMSMKVAKSIGLSNKLNPFFPVILLKSYILHLFIHTYHMV